MNKMFKKIVATTAVVSTVACLSVSAFAATAKYTEGTNSVAVTLGENEALTTGAQYTIIVVPAIWDPSVEGADDQIYYINQGAAEGENGEFETILAKAALKDGIPNGTYQVRFGTDATTSIATAEFTVGPSGTQITLDYGDVNGDGAVAAADATSILQKAASIITEFKDAQNRIVPEKVGDVNGDNATAAADATSILQKAASIITEFKDAEGNLLTTYTYNYVAPTE